MAASDHLTRFDPMVHLDTPEDHRALLADAIATGDADVIEAAVIEIARGRTVMKTTGD